MYMTLTGSFRSSAINVISVIHKMFNLKHFLFHVFVKEMSHASVTQLLLQHSASSRTEHSSKEGQCQSSVFDVTCYSKPKGRHLWKKLTTAEDLSHDDTDTTASLVDFGSICRISTSGSFISAVINV
jgi:hypothetical protein